MIILCRRLLGAPICRFALIGALGAALNLLIMARLLEAGFTYVAAALVSNESTIISNFVLQEKLVFNNGLEHRRPLLFRFIHSFTFNTLEGLARIPLLWCLVELGRMPGPSAQGTTLVVAFFLRYAYHLKLVYQPALKPEPSGLAEGNVGLQLSSESEP